jgi:hypothetical protein
MKFKAFPVLFSSIHRTYTLSQMPREIIDEDPDGG